MEHRLILGGEQFLPFARSRIKALKALGLPYADQSFEVDGVSIKVRIQPGHEYIRLEGGQPCSIFLDNGVVELGGWSGFDPDLFDDGTLIPTNSYLNYVAEFLPTQPPSDWMTKSAETSAGQFAGRLTKKKALFSGAIPADEDKSFSFSAGLIKNSAVPPEIVRNATDGFLAAKKYVATFCPASIFTGKTRLYVQSLYGAASYKESKTDKNGIITSAGLAGYVPTLVAESGSTAPALLVASYFRRDDPYPDVLMNTSSGVFLDKVTGKHWLINIGYSDAVVYPLVGSACAESMRKYLKDGSDLTDDDAGKLEAYILSTCRPDAKYSVVLATGHAVQNYSLGYGWHWNWSGTSADIVVSSQFFQKRVTSTDFYAMKSTHHRMTLTASHDIDPDTQNVMTTFALSHIEVESEKLWALERSIWCLAEPNWGINELEKVTPRYTELFACNAPIYAFYIKDDLKVCRVRVQQLSGTVSKKESSPGFYDGIGGSYLTLANDGGYGEITSSSGTYYGATLSCGEESISNLFAYRSDSGMRDDISSKSNFGEHGGYVNYRIEEVTMESGRPDEVPYPKSEFHNSGVEGYPAYNVWFSIFIDLAYSHTHAIVSDTYNSSATLVAPFFDAEAFYLEGQGEKVRSLTSRVRNDLTGGKFGDRSRYQPVDYYTGQPVGPMSADYDLWVWGYAYDGAVIAATADEADVIESQSIVDKSTLVCRAGSIDVDVRTDLYYPRFHNDIYETIPSTFKTLTGTKIETPVAISVFLESPIGAESNPTAPVIVGWA